MFEVQSRMISRRQGEHYVTVPAAMLKVYGEVVARFVADVLDSDVATLIEQAREAARRGESMARGLDDIAERRADGRVARLVAWVRRQSTDTGMGAVLLAGWVASAFVFLVAGISYEAGAALVGGSLWRAGLFWLVVPWLGVGLPVALFASVAAWLGRDEEGEEAGSVRRIVRTPDEDGRIEQALGHHAPALVQGPYSIERFLVVVSDGRRVRYVPEVVVADAQGTLVCAMRASRHDLAVLPGDVAAAAALWRAREWVRAREAEEADGRTNG